MDQDSQTPFKIWFHPHIKKIIHAAFSYMSENYHITGVIDHAAWIIQEGELESLLPIFTASDEVEHCISFSSNEYDKFVRLIDYAGYAAQKQEDRALLELLYESFMDSDSGNNRIYTLMAFAPDNLAALVSAFGKMIDDPDAIDNSMYDLTEWPQFVDLTNRLKDLEVRSDRQVFVPMTFGEWATYSSYLSHVFDLDQGDLSSNEVARIGNLLAEIYPILRHCAKPES